MSNFDNENSNKDKPQRIFWVLSISAYVIGFIIFFLIPVKPHWLEVAATIGMFCGGMVLSVIASVTAYRYKERYQLLIKFLTILLFLLLIAPLLYSEEYEKKKIKKEIELNGAQCNAIIKHIDTNKGYREDKSNYDVNVVYLVKNKIYTKEFRISKSIARDFKIRDTLVIRYSVLNPDHSEFLNKK